MRFCPFLFRGGAEHGLGIYVSEVEVGSEAHLQGLRTGDQILKVGGGGGGIRGPPAGTPYRRPDTQGRRWRRCMGSEAHLQGLRTGDQILKVGEGGGGIRGPPAGTPYRRPDTQGRRWRRWDQRPTCRDSVPETRYSR
jgi:hypothetical protein